MIIPVCYKIALSWVIMASMIPGAMGALIVVDYTYDTNNFFDTQAKRDVLQAAADRYSRIITSSLDAVSASGTGTGTSAGWRIGFTNPGTGASHQISTATSFATDPLSGAGAADVYGFSGLNQDEWILFAGGRSLGSAGVGGTGTGINFTTTFDDVNGPMHRGFNDNTPSNSVNDLPRWGGSISFNTAENWHFDLSTVAGSGEVDFYSIALHEIGHALGLNTSWNQWDQSGGIYLGADAIATYNTENGTSLTSLELESTTNPHFKDGEYDSPIFAAGDPVLVGTVGLGGSQDLLMEPIANFSASQRRFELTDVDVAALRDVGWSTTPIPEPEHISLLLMSFMVAFFAVSRRRQQKTAT